MTPSLTKGADVAGRDQFRPGTTGGGGSGSRGMSSGNSGGFGTTALTTAPSHGEIAGMGSAPDSAGALGGTYAAAGAGTAESPGGAYLRSGASLDAGDGSGTTEESFTPDDPGATSKVMGTDDPDDYFTRLGLADSLFKIVERRYRQKSTAWTTDSLRSGRLK